MADLSTLSNDQLIAVTKGQKLKRMSNEDLARMANTSLPSQSRPNPFSIMDSMKEGAKFARQVGTGYAGGYSGGLTDPIANKAGVPQSTGRDIGGIAGMFNPSGLALRAGRAGTAMATRFLPKAAQKFAGGMAVRGAEGAMVGGASQLGRSVEEGSVAPALQGAALGGAVGGAIPVRAVPYGVKPKWAQKKFGEVLKEADDAGSQVDVTKQLKHIRDIMFKKAGSDEATKALKDKLVSYSEKFNKDLMPILKDRNVTKLPPTQAQDVINLLGAAGRSSPALQSIQDSIRKGIYGSLTESGKKVYSRFSAGQKFKKFVLSHTVDVPRRLERKLLGDRLR